MKERPALQTVADLKRRLSIYPDHYEVDFSGLDFYRLKQRGEELIQVEFSQPVYRGADGRVIVENLD
jgi:hypothetical protein